MAVVRASRHKNFVNKRTPADALRRAARKVKREVPRRAGPCTLDPKKFVPTHWTTLTFERIKRLSGLFIIGI